MKKRSLWMGLTALGLVAAGCSEPDMDKDGVPKIDVHGKAIVERVTAGGVPLLRKDKSGNLVPETTYEDRAFRVVTVRGKDMRLPEFINTYCLGKERTNDTCARAAKIASLDFMRSDATKLPVLPAGL